VCVCSSSFFFLHFVLRKKTEREAYNYSLSFRPYWLIGAQLCVLQYMLSGKRHVTVEGGRKGGLTPNFDLRPTCTHKSVAGVSFSSYFNLIAFLLFLCTSLQMHFCLVYLFTSFLSFYEITLTPRSNINVQL